MRVVYKDAYYIVELIEFGKFFRLLCFVLYFIVDNDYLFIFIK